MGIPWKHWHAGPMLIQPTYYSQPANSPYSYNTPYAPGYDGYPYAESSQQQHQQPGKGKKAAPHASKDSVKAYLEGVTNHERGYQENMASMGELEQIATFSRESEYTPIITQVLAQRLKEGWPRNYKALDIIHFLQTTCALPPLPHLLEGVQFLHYTPIDHPRGAAKLLHAKTGQILTGWDMETIPAGRNSYGGLGLAGGRTPDGAGGDYARAVSFGGMPHSQTFARAVTDSLRSVSAPWPGQALMQAVAPTSAWNQHPYTHAPTEQPFSLTTTTLSVRAPIDEHFKQHLYKVETDRLAARGW